MRFVDTYLEDVSTVDITATYVNYLALYLLSAITLSFGLVQSVFWALFYLPLQKFNLIVGAL